MTSMLDEIREREKQLGKRNSASTKFHLTKHHRKDLQFLLGMIEELEEIIRFEANAIQFEYPAEAHKLRQQLALAGGDDE